MKKLILGILLFPSLVLAATPPTPAQIILSPESRLQYYPKLSSTTIGMLGFITQVLDEGNLLGSATWFNFVGSGVSASCSGGTCTITINGGGGGGGGGSGFYFDASGITAVSTFSIPFVQGQFNSSFATIPVFGATANITGSGTYYSTQTFRNAIYISSNVLIYSTQPFNIPLQVGMATIAPVTPLTTLLVSDARNASGISRIVIKNAQSGEELYLSAEGDTAFVGTRNSFSLGLLAGNVQTLHISSGANNDATQIWAHFGGQNARFKVSDETSFSERPSSMFEVKNGSITNNGTNTGIYVANVGSVSANAFESRGSSIAVQTYTLVFSSSLQATVGKHLIITQINGSNYLIGAGDDAVGAGSSSGGGSGVWIATGNAQFSHFATTVIVNGTALSTSAFDTNIATLTFTAGAGSSGEVFGYISTRNVDMNGFAVVNSSQILVGGSTGPASVQISSFNAGATWVGLEITTGAPTPLLDVGTSSMTLASPVTAYILGPLIQGSTISTQLDVTGQSSYILRTGPLLNSAMISSVFNGTNRYLFTDNNATNGKMIYMNKMGANIGKLEWGYSSTGPSGYFGTFTNDVLQIRINDSEVARFDTSGNMGINTTAPTAQNRLTVNGSQVTGGSQTVYGVITTTGGLIVNSATAAYANFSGSVTLGIGLELKQWMSTVSAAVGGSGITTDQANALIISTYNTLSGSTATLAIINVAGGTFDGGGSALVAPSTFSYVVPTAVTITGWSVRTPPDDAAGSVSIGVTANLAPRASICASACPGITSDRQNENNTLTGWTTALNSGTTIYFALHSATTLTKAEVTLKGYKR